MNTFLFITACLLAMSSELGVQSRVPLAQLTEELRIDGRAEDFSVLSGGHVNARGYVALTFRQDAQIRVYDATGKRIATYGRLGSGPGEFRFPQVQGWDADTVWVYDFMLRRHTFVSRNGKLIRMAPNEADSRPLFVIPRDPSLLISNMVFGSRRSDGGYLGTAQIVRHTNIGRQESRLSAISTSANGSVRILADAEQDARWEYEFAYTRQVAYAADGREMIQVSVSDLKENGEFLTVLRLGYLGDTVFAVKVPYRGVPMPAKHIDSVLKRGVGVDRNHKMPVNRIPKVYSPVSFVFAQSASMTGLVMLDAENTNSVMMLNRKGKPVARFVLPARSLLMSATNTQVWLIQTDDDGMQSVVRYRLSCAGRPCGFAN